MKGQEKEEPYRNGKIIQGMMRGGKRVCKKKNGKGQRLKEWKEGNVL